MDDVDAIRRLIHLYAERLDAGDFDGVAELFANAEFGASDRPEPLRGAAQVRRVYDSVRLYDDGTPRTKHVISNIVIDVGGDGAAASRCSVTVLQATDGSAIQPVLSARYHDMFEQVDDVWEFRKRVILVDAIGDLSGHMTG